MRILVTGASGFVGGAFVARFRHRDDLELLATGRRPLTLPGYVEADLTRPLTLAFRPDVVIHAAARAAPWGSAAAFHAQNVLATQNVIDYCLRNGNPRLVYISSSSVFYRNEDQLGLTEASPIGPWFVNAYARTKYEGELLVQRYEGSWIILRPRAVFGPGDTTVFPRIVRAAREGKLPRFKRDGAPAKADVVYIDTLSDYILGAAESTHTGAYNVTNGEPVETEAFLFGILDRLGIPLPTRRISIGTARLAAWGIEELWRLLRPESEPPVTRFGVTALAYSKTFDVRKLLATFGRPSVSVAEGVERFVASLRRATT